MARPSIVCWNSIAVLLLILPGNSWAANEKDTVNWWGDDRRWELPDGAGEFYDLFFDYDGTLCGSQGGGELRADAVSDFVYFGRLIGATMVANSTECLSKCKDNEACRAVNYYKPMTYQDRGFCEQLADTQRDNPLWMRPYKNAVYYERIACGQPGVNKVDKTDKESVEFLEKLFGKVSNFVRGPGEIKKRRRL